MKKRRILLALIMLIISGISLTTATYAWFTSNRAVEVEELDVKAQASGGIQISADASNWSNVVNKSDLLAAALPAAGINNYIPNLLKPVTTVGRNGNKDRFDFYLGTLNDGGNLVNLASTADSANNYIAFDLYFYSATDQIIMFNSGTEVVAKNVGGSGEAVDQKLRSSVRVGFLVLGNDPTSTPATAIGLNGAVAADASQMIWEPHADVHTTFAINNLGATGIMTTMGGKAATGPTDYVSMTSATHFRNVVAATDGLIQTTEAGVYPATHEFNFKAGITKVRIYVWLEGQDIDNEDTATLGTGVGVKLNFKIKDQVGA